ncbi:MAG: hypothetical protein ACREP2_08755 [Rhodanobacteraceae bacterium]
MIGRARSPPWRKRRDAGVSIEGGGAWIAGGSGIAHFLFADGAAATRTLQRAAIHVLAEREVLAQRLRQDVPGQLGLLARRMTEAGVNIEVMYSDHANQSVLVVDDIARGRAASEAWIRESNRSRAAGPADDKRRTTAIR